MNGSCHVLSRDTIQSFPPNVIPHQSHWLHLRTPDQPNQNLYFNKILVIIVLIKV